MPCLTEMFFILAKVSTRGDQINGDEEENNCYNHSCWNTLQPMEFHVRK